MTRDEILNMEEGLGMDLLVGEMVMGYDYTGMKSWLPERWVGPPDPYSTNIAAAWEVMEKMRSDPFNKGIEFSVLLAKMFDATQDDYITDVYNVLMNLSPLAICRAALLAVMEVA